MAAAPAMAQIPGQRPRQSPDVVVINPRNRVPVTQIIDDSTCLVNLNRFTIPQFAAGTGYKRYSLYDWRSMPHEIPDVFVQKFGEWCEFHGVKGKYSIVPYPACVGRLDRELPGWTSRELASSIKLVRDFMTKSWDIHPEMVTHTRVIDTKTGHPYPHFGPKYIENWEWTDGKTVDEIADYITYALTILKNIELPCEGVTSPGEFGTRVRGNYPQAVLEACRHVYGAEIPHYFLDVIDSGDESVAPRVHYASGLDGDDPRCVVEIIGCTDDWTGNWDASRAPDPDRFITEDLSEGRLVDVIGRGEPAFLVAHWTGFYYSGRELGFKAFREVVRRLHRKYDNIVWMKVSEIARYWAARELTGLESKGDRILLRAPFACPAFTIEYATDRSRPPVLTASGRQTELREVQSPLKLSAGAWFRDGRRVLACFDLPKGNSTLQIA